MTVKKSASSTTAITGPTSGAIIDLDALAYLDQAECKIVHPADKKIELFTVTLAGPGHPQTLAQQEEDRRVDLAELEEYQREQQEALVAGKPVPRTPEQRRTVAELRQRNAKRLAARVISASGDIRIGGEVISLTRDTAATVLGDPKFSWLFEQVAVFLRNQENFTPASAKA